MRACGPAALLFVFSLSLAPAALADPPPLERERDARELADRAYAHYRRGEYAEAIALFEQAEMQSHSIVIVRYIAEAHEQLGQLLAAQQQYQRILDEQLPDDAIAEERDAQSLAKRKLPILQTRIPKARLQISGAPLDKLEVQLDGRPVPVAQLGAPFAVDPGQHVVVVRPPSGPPVTRSFRALEQQLSEVEVVFAEREEPRAGASADRSWIAPAIAFGVGFAGVSVGAVSSGIYFDRAEDLKDRCPENVCAPELEEERDTISAIGTVSVVGFAVAGAATAVGVVALVLTGEDGAGAAQVRVGPDGIAVGGRF